MNVDFNIKKTNIITKQNFILSFVVIIAFFLVFLIVSYFLTSSAVKSKKDDSVLINVAGRQRMLIHEYVKEVTDKLITLQIRHHTLKTAEIASLQILEDRKLYTSNVIEKLEKEIPEVHPNKEYAEIVGGIPLPSTFLREASEVINQKGIYSYQLLSKWNVNKDMGLNTDFEKEAFDYLYLKKEDVFFRFIVYNNLYTLRYARADYAYTEACVRCHNALDKSPKKDFKLGDVMGILVVNVPIGPVSEQTSAFFNRSAEGDVGADSFLKTKENFERTLEFLLKGGTVPLDIEMAQFTDIPTIITPEIRNKLEEVKKLWHVTLESFDKLLEVEPDSVEYIVAHNASYNATNDILKSTDQVVTLMQMESQQKLNQIKTFQTYTLIVEGLFFLIITAFVYFRVVTPLEKQSVDLEKQRKLYISINSKLAIANEKEKEQNLVAAGQTELNDVMRGVKDIETLCRDIVSVLAIHLNAQVGAMYVTDENQNLSLAGSYALKNSGNDCKDFKFGEGLIGQAAMDRKSKILTNVPEGYFEISSGLAEVAPRNILITPFLYEGKVKGVIELGSTNKFTDKEQGFQELVAESIAIAIHTAQSRQQLQDLLEESQTQAVES